MPSYWNRPTCIRRQGPICISPFAMSNKLQHERVIARPDWCYFRPFVQVDTDVLKKTFTAGCSPTLLNPSVQYDSWTLFADTRVASQWVCIVGGRSYGTIVDFGKTATDFFAGWLGYLSTWLRQAPNSIKIGLAVFGQWWDLSCLRTAVVLS